MRFNVLEHKHVPEHRLLTPQEADDVLARLRITRDQLPKIRKTDPVIRLLERVHGEIAEGSLVRVFRLTQTAGVSEAYRLVVGR